MKGSKHTITWYLHNSVSCVKYNCVDTELLCALDVLILCLMELPLWFHKVEGKLGLTLVVIIAFYCQNVSSYKREVYRIIYGQQLLVIIDYIPSYSQQPCRQCGETSFCKPSLMTSSNPFTDSKLPVFFFFFDF